MSEHAVGWIIGRALTDLEYRERLLTEPDGALDGYALTHEEARQVRGWTRRRFEAVIDDLEAQVAGARFDGRGGFEPGGVGPPEPRHLVRGLLSDLLGLPPDDDRSG
jgi:hypothetical protein